MRNTLLFITVVFLCAALNCSAQVFTGKVVDASTYDYLPGVIITLMTEDSVKVNATSSYQPTSSTSDNNYRIMGKGPSRYILKFTMLGYKTTYLNCEVKNTRVSHKRLEDVKMRIDPKMLPEIAVQTTKIKMVVKNDTLIYNADAFQVAEGAMLDRLVAMLPGVELNGGRIKVNGRFVSSLLVNGEDFFKGDPNVALDNMPAYMVDKVKVYEREAEDAYIRKPDPAEELPLVMDVHLKKQYMVGWMANAEAAYGTDNRYIGRLFGLRFTEHSRLSVFGNLNNLNDTRQPGTSGNWNPVGTVEGRTDLKTAGVELLINDKYKRYKLTSNVKVDYREADVHNEVSRVRFLEGGDVFGRSRNLKRESPMIISSQHQIELKKTKVYFRLLPSVEYNRHRNRAQFYMAEFTGEPAERYRGAALDSLFKGKETPDVLNDLLVNQTARLTKGIGHLWQGRLSGMATIQSPREGDWLLLNLSGSLHNNRFEQFNHNDLRYGQVAEESKNDFRNHYADIQSETYNVAWSAEYMLKFTSNSQMQIRYNGEYSSSSSDNALYRLDRYETWNAAYKHPLGALPSTRDSLLNALDLHNSVYDTKTSFWNRPQIQFSTNFRSRGSSLGVVLPLDIRHEELKYRQDRLDTVVQRTTTAFVPHVYYSLRKKYYNLRADYRFNVTHPSMTDMLDVRNDANPLVVRLGNPHLDRGHIHKVSLRMNGALQKRQRSYGVGGEYVRQTNSVAQGVTYDRTTGISTYRPENVDGNWQASGYVDYSQAVDKKQRVQLSTNTSVNYLNSVDLSRIAGNDRSTRSEVGNFNLSETLRADYRYNGYSFGVKARASWRHSASDRRDFTTINSVDFNYGLTALVPLPWKLELSTDLTMFSRRGYNDRSMNTDDLVWNARLSRTFLKGNLICMIDGFDILGRLSNITQNINEQGRTETWRNVVHRYAMLHVAYRLNRQPKKKTY